ncbi:hypothetical protein BMAFMH_B0996 [Burkholderia mallei FMH]|nr:hypothetical protein BMAFMH_B0996 [Burkholderia mallei FMH]
MRRALNAAAHGSTDARLAAESMRAHRFGQWRVTHPMLHRNAFAGRRKTCICILYVIECSSSTNAFKGSR